VELKEWGPKIILPPFGAELECVELCLPAPIHLLTVN
jgi:hypothetical protein